MKVIIKKQVYENQEIEITDITLLKENEANKLADRFLEYKHTWWLRSAGSENDFVIGVTSEGWFADNYNIDDNNIVVRPILIFNSNNFKVGDIFKFKNKKFEVIKKNMAFCLTDIGKHIFDNQSNDFEKSEIKQYLKKWLGDKEINDGSNS